MDRLRADGVDPEEAIKKSSEHLKRLYEIPEATWEVI